METIRHDVNEPPGVTLNRAHRLLRITARRIDLVAGEEGWPTPFSPVRLLVLHHLREATAFGLSPRRLSRILALEPSSVAHHLDVLEAAQLVDRTRRGLYDRRKIFVRLTAEGRYALRRIERFLERRRMGPGSGFGELAWRRG